MILLTYGTRPEFLKIKPIILELKKRNLHYYTLFTGQHQDIVSNDVDIKLDMNYVISDNRLDTIIGNILKYGDEIFNNPEINFEYVLVQGDTTSVLGVALSAFNHGKKIIHLEAGLRTYDNQNPYPEEINRRMVSLLADIHFCPTELSKDNLINERIDGDMYVVGNTALDNLIDWKRKVKSSNIILVTLHRRENHKIMNEWFIEINQIAKRNSEYDFIFPVHPNPNVQECKKYIDAPNIKLVEPLQHDELLEILVKSSMVITDSGGIQEECSFFNKNCLVCREVTERPEAIGQSTVMVKNPKLLNKLFNIYLNYNRLGVIESPFGDGFSSKKIIDKLISLGIWNKSI